MSLCASEPVKTMSLCASETVCACDSEPATYNDSSVTDSVTVRQCDSEPKCRGASKPASVRQVRHLGCPGNGGWLAGGFVRKLVGAGPGHAVAGGLATAVATGGVLGMCLMCLYGHLLESVALHVPLKFAMQTWRKR